MPQQLPVLLDGISDGIGAVSKGCAKVAQSVPSEALIT